MSFTIGENCDIILVHENVNDGDPYGFIIGPDPSKQGPSFSVQRSLDSEDEIVIHLFATVLLSDNLKNPDGSEHEESRQEMYDMIVLYLAELESMSVDTWIGTFLGLGQFGHTATELHMVQGTYISLKFANLTKYHPPVDSETFYNSIWQDTPPAVDALTWESSVWR